MDGKDSLLERPASGQIRRAQPTPEAGICFRFFVSAGELLPLILSLTSQKMENSKRSSKIHG
jgi:hypothetical protein